MQLLKRAGFFQASSCCNYGAGGANGYDCVTIPGAVKTTGVITVMPLATRLCGRDAGLVSVTGITAKTICSKSQPV